MAGQRDGSFNEAGVIVALAGFVLVGIAMYRTNDVKDMVSLITAIGTIVGTVVGAVFGVKAGSAGTKQANEERQRAEQHARQMEAHFAALKAVAGPDAAAQALKAVASSTR